LLSGDSFVDPWAQAKSNLGSAYLRRIQDDRSENLEQAINCFQEGLTVYTQESFPEQWAKFLVELGDALFWRIKGDRSENLERSIKCLQAALTVYTQESFPEQWADATMRFGDTLTKRIRGDWANNLQQAIEYYQQILSIYTKESFPYFWARTKQHLGKAQVQYLLQGAIENNARVEDSNIYIEKAIAYFQEALQVFTPETFPKEWGSVKIDLGSLYFDWIQEESRENIQKAIGHFQSALQIYTLEASPLRWANTHNALGAAYIQPTLEDRANKIEQGIYHLHLSLQEVVRLQDPEQWAATQCNLGHAYGDRILGEKTENIARAIDCYTASLETYKSINLRRGTFLAGKDLGNLAFDNQIWDKAILGYSAAIEEMELLRTWIATDNRRQKSLEGNIDIYQNAIQSYIKIGQIDKALEYVERSHSKRLVDLMASNDLYGGGEIPQAVKELLQQHENLQQQIDNLRSQNNSGNNRGILNTDNSTREALELDRATISSLEAKKQEIWQQIRQLDPVLAGEIQVSSPNISQMQQLIDRPTTAILSFFTTNTETYIFILRQDRIELHTCIGQGTENLQNWLRQEWLIPYKEKDPQWLDRISPILAELARKLQIDELIDRHLDGIEELVIIPHLLLHQIPFSAIPIGKDFYLSDRFLIRHIPSCQVLEFCQQRQQIETITYGIVEDAEDNLPCASFEGEQIAQLYDIPRERRLQGSQEATCQNYRQLIDRVQVIHCCHHAESRLDNPLESRLKLADGSITLGQLMTPAWRLPDLHDVFLSCCETGLGNPSLTDDIFTLSTGFLCAGARTVVSTLWSVNDLATALFSIFYYQQLKQNRDRSLALQQAQIQLRQLKKEDLIAIEIVRQLQIRAKELRKEREKYRPDSAEYLQCKSQHEVYAGLASWIYKILNEPKEFPLSAPFYWAAFICQGSRYA
jgi:CHAT domain-containing protein